MITCLLNVFTLLVGMANQLRNVRLGLGWGRGGVRNQGSMFIVFWADFIQDKGLHHHGRGAKGRKYRIRQK